MELRFSLAVMILGIGLYQGVLTAILLWLRKSPNPIPSRLVAGLSAAIGFSCLQGLLIVIPGGFEPDAFFRINAFFPFLYGPLIYLYIRSFIQDAFRFQRMDLLHLLPALVILILMIILYNLGPDFRAELKSSLQQGAVPIYLRITALLLFLQVMAYLFFSIRTIYRFQSFIQASSSFSDQIRLRWLLSVLAVLIIPILTVLVLVLIVGRPDNPPQAYPFPAFGAAGLVCILHILYLIQPNIFSGLPPALQIKQDTDLQPKRYESSSLTDQQKEQYHKKLLAYIETHKPYLKQELTLAELATELNINAKYLSQVINELSQQNFMDFINSYRIQMAKEWLLSKEYQHFTIVAIAQEVGFKSRSAFYTAFKKGTGLTPSAFKQQAMLS